MAYMNQERKAALAPAIKAVLKKYKVKGTIGVHNHSSLVVNLREGALDFIGAANENNRRVAERRGVPAYEVNGYYQVNPYYADDSSDPKIARFFKELLTAMRGNMWYDRSDAQTDYFDTAYYMDINVGKWNKPYQITA
jgi:hypothetical protein